MRRMISICAVALLTGCAHIPVSTPIVCVGYCKIKVASPRQSLSQKLAEDAAGLAASYFFKGAVK